MWPRLAMLVNDLSSQMRHTPSSHPVANIMPVHNNDDNNDDNNNDDNIPCYNCTPNDESNKYHTTIREKIKEIKEKERGEKIGLLKVQSYHWC